MRISLFARAAAGTVGALVASSSVAFALAGAPEDAGGPEEDPRSEVAVAAVENAGAQGDDASTAGQEASEARTEEAAANHAAATQFASDIRAWTSCIQENAANPEETPRDDDFDPKDGCEGVASETTPGGQPFNPGADDSDLGPTADAGAEGRAIGEEHRGDAGSEGAAHRGR